MGRVCEKARLDDERAGSRLRYDDSPAQEVALDSGAHYTPTGTRPGAARPRPPFARPRRRRPWVVPFLLLSVLAHLVSAVVLAPILPLLVPAQQAASRRPVSLVIRPPSDKQQELEELEPPEPEYDGQIVEISPPAVEETPLESDYLSEYDSRTEHETRSERFEINPEVLSREFSREPKTEQAEEAEDLDMKEQSTGATVGNHRFDPDRDGTMAALPSPWRTTNKIGDQSPVLSSTRAANLAGAPQNDLLNEDIGKYVDLNTTRYPYAGYMARIRRQVNYWWEQNLDNLPASVRLAKSKYTTSVSVVLDGDGALESIEVLVRSGSGEIDDCVVRAFQLAGPFENPPAALVQKDGRVYLPEFDFTVGLQAAQMQYQGVDPRAGVQFPGILKSPR